MFIKRKLVILEILKSIIYLDERYDVYVAPMDKRTQSHKITRV